MEWKKLQKFQAANHNPSQLSDRMGTEQGVGKDKNGGREYLYF